MRHLLRSLQIRRSYQKIGGNMDNVVKVNIKINGIPFKVNNDRTILEAAKLVQVKIPKLCNHPDLPPSAACGLCIVKIKGSPRMIRSCTTYVEEGMEITTHDSEIFEIRRTVLELILSNH